MPSPPQPGDAPRPYRMHSRALPVARFAEEDLLTDPVIQDLAADEVVLSICQAYLQCEPILSILTMWWSSAVPPSHEEAVTNAQLFHFDMDRVKWVKMFIYLTDVSSDSGPHVLVSGTHRRGSQPRELLRRGYARLSDDDVVSRFPGRLRELTGPRGTVFFADTRALHKGKVPMEGERLVLQLEFCDSLLGGQYRRVEPVEVLSERLRRAAGALPHAYARWRLS